ncbi:hypothetical protein [Taklimakanibacter lacteus]|uniref:hypothetical protein n=1 Tax=Taklimakanibacter lacteus TaxID=2268456 RepID=UPI000E664001
MAERIIRIVPYGRLANQMFQLMMAERLRRSIKGAKIVGHSLPEWNLVGEKPPMENALSVTVRASVVPIEQVIEFANAVDYIDIKIMSVTLRYAYFRTLLDHFRALFRDPKVPEYTEAPKPDNLVIHIRLGDALTGSNRSYMPLPISWYDELIQRTGLEPVFVGEIGTDIYSETLQRRFPTARFLTQDRMRDFHFVRSATHVVPAIGTFSWLATWLSETARTIYFPVAGLFHQTAIPDMDLLPVDDPRYRFYRTALQKWDARPDQLDFLLNSNHDLRPVSRSHLKTFYSPRIGTYGLDIKPWPLVR